MAAFHLLFVLVLALAASSSASAVATADDNDVRLRQEAMVQALGVVTGFDLANTDPEAVRQVKRALAVLDREVQAHPQRWKTIFNAVDKAMDSGADDRSRAEASSLAKELLEQEFGPCPRCLKRDLRVEDL